MPVCWSVTSVSPVAQTANLLATGVDLSAAFDHNKAPYFQSFVEVQVLNAKDEVHFLPHGANGRLRWHELENFQALIPAGKAEADFVEFIIKMPPR